MSEILEIEIKHLIANLQEAVQAETQAYQFPSLRSDANLCWKLVTNTMTALAEIIIKEGRNG